MDDRPPLPELHQGELDPATLGRLFDDLHVHAEVLEIVPKHGPGYVADDLPPVSLQEARAMLLEGGVRGIQILYRYQQETWRDTLMPTAHGGCRIVRIRLDPHG